ncbi:MAG: hypothetical protein RL076_94 [Chloroflexota bacterium]
MPSALTAQVGLDRRRVVGHISPYVFGGFIEHMGRCVYEGIYDPGSPHADAQGIRLDVLDALKQMGVTIMRYPGGNFLSGYDWRDGVGPKAQRPRKRDLAWKSIETNQFGTHEFMDFVARLGAEPMLGVNMGTGDIALASAYIEYVNAPAGTYWADQRVANGRKEPWGVKWWCLGNEMDGPWQIGHLDAVEYGKKALEAAKMMRWNDDTVKLVLAGSSSVGMATYPMWDRTILELCYDHVDVLSMHYYAGNRNDDTPSYLALTREFETYVDSLASTINYVKAVKRSKKQVKLSWDEWNVWYKNMEMDGKWSVAPHLIEEVYNLEDAVLVGAWLNVFLRKCDVLEAACLAQMVNVIGPLLTTKEGMLKQSIYYPFQMVASRAKGDSLDVWVDSPLYSSKKEADVPMLDVSASWDADTETGGVYIVNRNLKKPITVTITVNDGLKPVVATGGETLWGTDPKAFNTFSAPNAVVSAPLTNIKSQKGKITVTVPPLSTSAIDLRV